MNQPHCHARRQGGFSMIEIAIALAVIAFALVAIVGVLPSGMQVQRESKEKTIINEEARYFMDAIKSGARRLDELTNFVESLYTVSNGRSYNERDLVNGSQVIGLLSTPGTNILETRAIAGSASERGSLGRDLAFRYRLTVEITPFPFINPGHPDLAVIDHNLWDLRLEFGWPLLPGGNVGSGQAVFRSMVTARMSTNPPPPNPPMFYLFRQ